MSAHLLHSQHTYCTCSIAISAYTHPIYPRTHILHTQHNAFAASMTHSQHVALATKLPFKALYSYPSRKGDQKYQRKKIPLGEKLYITMKEQNGQKLTEKNFT